MYGMYSSNTGVLAGFGGILLLILLLVFIVWLLAINMLIKAAREKGYHRNSSGILWVIGIFASPVILGLYTASLPDHSEDANRRN